jgi:hypothetical protein
MEYGSEFIQYTSIGSKHTVFVFLRRDQGCIFWNPGSSDTTMSPERCIPVRAIVAIYFGKNEPIFFTKPTFGSCCFSIVTTQQSLYLMCDENVAQQWLEGFQRLLSEDARNDISCLEDCDFRMNEAAMKKEDIKGRLFDGADYLSLNLLDRMRLRAELAFVRRRLHDLTALRQELVNQATETKSYAHILAEGTSVVAYFKKDDYFVKASGILSMAQGDTKVIWIESTRSSKSAMTIVIELKAIRGILLGKKTQELLEGAGLEVLDGLCMSLLCAPSLHIAFKKVDVRTVWFSTLSSLLEMAQPAEPAVIQAPLSLFRTLDRNLPRVPRPAVYDLRLPFSSVVLRNATVQSTLLRPPHDAKSNNDAPPRTISTPVTSGIPDLPARHLLPGSAPVPVYFSEELGSCERFGFVRYTRSSRPGEATLVRKEAMVWVEDGLVHCASLGTALEAGSGLDASSPQIWPLQRLRGVHVGPQCLELAGLSGPNSAFVSVLFDAEPSSNPPGLVGKKTVPNATSLHDEDGAGEESESEETCLSGDSLHLRFASAQAAAAWVGLLWVALQVGGAKLSVKQA